MHSHICAYQTEVVHNCVEGAALMNSTHYSVHLPPRASMDMPKLAEPGTSVPTCLEQMQEQWSSLLLPLDIAVPLSCIFQPLIKGSCVGPLLLQQGQQRGSQGQAAALLQQHAATCGWPAGPAQPSGCCWNCSWWGSTWPGLPADTQQPNRQGKSVLCCHCSLPAGVLA